MPDTDLLIVGGGPAGCAAAVMASSLGMTTTLIEPRSPGHKLNSISAMVNVLGGFSTGRELATRIADDIAKTAHCDVLLGRTAIAVHASDDDVNTELDDGQSYRSPYVVIASGVRPQMTAETSWISQDSDIHLPPLWEAELDSREVLVLGIDRPLGTLLRTNADPGIRLIVLYSAEEQYKADEIRADERVILIPTAHLDLTHDPDGTFHVRAVAEDSTERSFMGAHLFLNLGSRPVPPAGDVRADESGYCPPDRQYPRLLIAGDLRSARYQRVMTALGSGAEAALSAYYDLNQVK